MQSFLAESHVIPDWASAAGLTRCFVYTGPSMQPTFLPGQLLYIHEQTTGFEPGDVIIFVHPNVENPIVHRVVSVLPIGLITRGDNNRAIDPDPVKPEEIIGRVEQVAIGKEHFPVINGERGLFRARVGWFIRKWVLHLRILFHDPYIRLRRFTPLRRVLQRMFGRYVMMIRLQYDEVTMIKIVFRGRTIGLFVPARGYFFCRRPFDLFIDPPNL